MPKNSGYPLKINKEGYFLYTCDNCRDNVLKV